MTATPAEGQETPFAGLSDEESALLASLRAGDEAAFMTLVERYHNALIRLALIYLPSREVAEEVAQETWLGVLQGIERFEGRSSIKTWIFRILTNRAQTRGKREARTLPFSAVFEADDDREAAVDSGRFHRFKWGQRGTWSQPPEEWEESPEELALAKETHAVITDAIALLSPAQREVITLRDIEGWTSTEVCNALSVTETNQRVLLHRGRSKVRKALEQHLKGRDVRDATR